jgi:hypothetical protein
MLSVVQTVGVIIAALVSAYAVGATEASRRRDSARVRVERVLEAALGLTEAAVRVQEVQGQAAQFQVARIRLKAALQLVGTSGFEHTELMVRDTATPADISAQGEQAILEIGARLEELDPRPLWRRQPHIDFRKRAAGR